MATGGWGVTPTWRTRISSCCFPSTHCVIVGSDGAVVSFSLSYSTCWALVLVHGWFGHMCSGSRWPATMKWPTACNRMLKSVVGVPEAFCTPWEHICGKAKGSEEKHVGGRHYYRDWVIQNQDKVSVCVRFYGLEYELSRKNMSSYKEKQPTY